ncbi:MAG: aldo/keto reductase [Lentisphaeria bacterium]|nr:aldo/keto reductase [Lentisphaeria bacterium]NQZ66583.1 aldo/keto reductase [Lentisphaeria bacterium]
MQYREFGKTGINVSVIGLGGHEFGEGGYIRGFGDDGKLAVQRGYVFDGFGQENRQQIVAKALDLGINLFDLAIDSEKDAMGRQLKDLKPSEEILIQTRPEGMVYSYDPENRQMAQYDLLKTEVQRICKMIGRDCVDILNVAFLKTAVDADPDYMAKIGDNVSRLKEEGLIRFASADTFSGERFLLSQLASGHFDSTFISYNPTDQAMEDKIIPDAHERGIALIARECFRKGQWFAIAEEAGLTDRAFVAHLGIKWCLRDDRIASVVLGVASAEQLESNCEILNSPGLSDEESSALEKMLATDFFKKELVGRTTSLKK